MMRLTDFENSTVLVAEDDARHALLIQRAFAVAGLKNPLQLVMDGEEAIRYLSGQGAFADRVRYPIPGVLLLDLRMPRVSGLEVLQWIRKQSRLDGLMISVVTSMRELPEVEKAFELGASAYLVKPVHALDLEEVMERFGKYYPDWVCRPHGAYS